MSRLGIMLAVAAAAVSLAASPAWAHSFTYPNEYSVESMSPVAPLNHTDVPDCSLEESKGFFQITVLNNTNIQWSAFHFDLIRLTSQVKFVATPEMQPTSSVTLNSPTPWALTDTSFDFFFSNHKVAPGSSATFKVWTDNTANGNPFAVVFYPVPEPATMGLLALGATGVLARRRRR